MKDPPHNFVVCGNALRLKYTCQSRWSSRIQKYSRFPLV